MGGGAELGAVGVPAVGAFSGHQLRAPPGDVPFVKEEKEIRPQVMVIFLDGIAVRRHFGRLKCGLWGVAVARTSERGAVRQG